MALRDLGRWHDRGLAIGTLKSDLRFAFSRRNMLGNLVGLLLLAAINFVWPVILHAVSGLTWPYLIPLGMAGFLILAAAFLHFRAKPTLHIEQPEIGQKSPQGPVPLALDSQAVEQTLQPPRPSRIAQDLARAQDIARRILTTQNIARQAARDEADALVGRIHSVRSRLFGLQQNPLASLARSMFPLNQFAGEVRAVIHDSDQFVRREEPELAETPPRFTSVTEAIEATDAVLETLRQVQVRLRDDGG